MAPPRLSTTRARFADSGLTICCLGSSAHFAAPETRAKSREELKGYIELAAALGCPLVRVFGGHLPEGDRREDATCAVADELSAMAEFARRQGVGIALETHDAFSTGAEVAAVLERTPADVVGAVWDLYHPFHRGEPLDVTFRRLRPYLRHVHVKDVLAGDYCRLGEGDVPIQKMLQLLLSPQPDEEATAPPAFLSVEWEKRWIPDLAEPEVVLPQYAATLRAYLQELAS